MGNSKKQHVFMDNWPAFIKVLFKANPCVSRVPITGEAVKSLTGTAQSATTEQGEKDGWKLQPDETATVIEVRENGGFTLKNQSGIVSGWQFRKNYAYLAQAKPSAGPEARALPPGWTEHVDEASGEKFYHHAATGESSWERPAEAHGISASDAASTMGDQASEKKGKKKT